MTQRSARQRDIDDRAFPIRVKVHIPPHGLGNELTRMDAWLREELGPTECAQHPATSLGGDAVGFHFRRIEDAARFLAAFPLLELADATTSRAYRSPHRQEGR